MTLVNPYMQCDFGSLLNVYSGRARLGGTMLALVPGLRARAEEAPPPGDRLALAEVPRVRFAFQPLRVPHTALVRTGGATQLFVRFSSPVKGSEVIAVPPMLEQEVALAVKAARRDGHPVDQVFLVGTDALLAGHEGQGAAVEAFASLLRSVAKEGVPFTWRTRGGLPGLMPAPLSQALRETAALATLEIGLPSLDRALCHELEGGQGAPPEQRLKLASAAAARGVAVRGLLDPLVPMLTDQRGALEPLLEALADAGVHRVGVRYLVLTREKAKGLSRRLSRMHRDLIQGCFAAEPWRQPRAEGATVEQKPHKLLPRALREKGHARVVDIAARQGIVVDVLDPPRPDEDVVLSEPAPKAAKARRGETKAGAQVEAQVEAQVGSVKKPQLDLFRVRR